MADFRLGRLKFNWRGDWAAATAYVIDDIVKFGANTYVATANHTSVSTAAQWYGTDAGSWSLHTEGIYNAGDWAATTFYKNNDIVKYGNILYRTTTPHTSTATFDPAKFSAYLDGLKFEDTWDSATEYQKGDIVTYGGYSYIALQTSTAIQPNNGIGVQWDILTTGFKVVGNWNSTTTYKPGDVVLLGGNSYVAKTTNINSSPASNPSDWDFIVGGFTWRGTWDVGTTYFPGDAVTRNSNSHICVAENTAQAPETDTNGTYWNSLAEGASANVLTTSGDVLYQGGAGPARLPIGTENKVLTVSSEGYPAWKESHVTHRVYYVTPEGSDLNAGNSITAAWRTVRHAVDNVTGPATIYVKAGTYNEILPMRIPEQVGIVGDNLRTSRIQPRTGEPSSVVKLTLAQVPDASYRVLGSTITSGDGSKSGEIIDVREGGSDIYVQTDGFENNKTADAYNLLTSNTQFLVKETLAKAAAGGVTITNPPGGDASVFEGKLATLIQDITANLGYGGNDRVYDTLNDWITNNYWNGNEAEVVSILGYFTPLAKDVINNETITVTGTHGLTQVINNSITDINTISANVTCVVQDAAITTLVGVATTGLTSGLGSITRDANQNLWTTTDTFEAGATDIAISSVTPIMNENLTMWMLGSTTMLKDMVMDGMVGFVPSVSDPKDLNTATIGGVYVRLDPNSPIKRSPYVSNCSCFGATGVGAIIDGDVHAKWDNTAQFTPTGATYNPSTGDLELTLGSGHGLTTGSSIQLAQASITFNCTKNGGASNHAYPRTTDPVFGKEIPIIATSNTTITINVGVAAPADQYAHTFVSASANAVIFDNRSNKTMVFDSWTQIHEDGGVGFWCTNKAGAEIVSCFTYYCHVSYASTRGGRIRSLAGNSSWGTYGIVSSGYDTTETTLDGKIDGLSLEYDEATIVPGATDSIWLTGERVIGLTSGAVGEIISVQAGVSKILYRPFKGTFVQNEVIDGQTSGVQGNLVNNADAVGGQNGFVLAITGRTAAPVPGGSMEFVTGAGGLGEEPFTFVIANSSYTAPAGRGNLTVTRGLLGSAAASHLGLELITRYQYGGATNLSSAVNSASDSTIYVNTISGFSIGAYLIIGDEMMGITSFPTATSMDVTRGVEGTNATAHNNGESVRAIEIKVVDQTDTLRDITSSQTDVRITDASGFNINDYIKIDNEFMQVTQSQTDSTGTALVVLAAEKPTRTFDGQDYKIRYGYSQVRLTGHDFLDLGTGNKIQTNWPGDPLVDPAPGNEVTEDFPGRVFFVSTDQDGNFTVGRYFKVNQATGSTTLNASSFDLSGLSSLRLGSIGAQLGESITEFSSDVTLSANSNQKVPTQRAVKTYVDTTRTTKGYVFWAGSV